MNTLKLPKHYHGNATGEVSLSLCSGQLAIKQFFQGSRFFYCLTTDLNHAFLKGLSLACGFLSDTKDKKRKIALNVGKLTKVVHLEKKLTKNCKIFPRKKKSRFCPSVDNSDILIIYNQCPCKKRVYCIDNSIHGFLHSWMATMVPGSMHLKNLIEVKILCIPNFEQV